MAKRKQLKQATRKATPYQPRKKSNVKRYLIIGLLSLALISFILMSIPKSPTYTGPRFTDEGDLAIYRDGTSEPIVQLDIELADDEESRVKGLMYRQKMEEDQGMLFIMEANEPQSFWMLNTYISLDIIYIGEDKKIVSIQRNTTPKSTDPVPSGAPAKYVLEVNAGYAERHGLQVGDELVW
jgi:uncharacterized membrane protein (UPF0127 family)